jgi:hypothetical protein
MKGLSSLIGMTPLLSSGEKVVRGEHATTHEMTAVVRAMVAPRSVRENKGRRCFEVMVKRCVKVIPRAFGGTATVVIVHP